MKNFLSKSELQHRLETAIAEAAAYIPAASREATNAKRIFNDLAFNAARNAAHWAMALHPEEFRERPRTLQN